MFKRLKGLKRVTPDERQAGPPRRSDGCGLGAAFACAVGRSEKFCTVLKVLMVFRVLRVFKRFKGLRAGKRQAWDAHKKPLMWPWGACWLRDGFEACKAWRTAGWTAQKKQGRFKGWQTAGLDAHKKQLMCPWGACWLRNGFEACNSWRTAGWTAQKKRVGLRAGKRQAWTRTILMWPWGACWLRD